MAYRQIISITKDHQLISEISEKISGLGDLLFFSNNTDAEGFVNSSSAELLLIFDINKDFSTDFIEKYKDKFSSIGLISKENFMDLFDKLNSLNIDKFITMPWEPGDLSDAVKNIMNISEDEIQSGSTNNEDSRKVISLQKELDNTRKIYDQQRSELEQVTSMLEFNLQQAESAKREMVPLLSALISLRLKQPLDEAILPAKLASKIAENFILEDEEYKQIYKAGMLHNIGMMALPDSIIGRTYNHLSPDEQRQFDDLVVKGQSILQAIPTFETISKTIRHLYERYDGTGFPDGLKGLEIPLHSRILVPAIDYFELQKGLYFEKKLSPKEALDFIIQRANSRYDPAVIKYFTKSINNFSNHFNQNINAKMEKVLPAVNQ